MKYLPLLIISFLMFCTFSCRSKHESKESDNLAQYRDTLIGNFNGLEIDTLICKLTDYGEPLPYDVYKECCYYYDQKPQSNISLSDIIGKWESIGRYERYILTLKQNGVYNHSLVMDIDTVLNPYGTIYFTKHGNYLYDSVTNRITLLDYHTRHELDSTDYIKYDNPLNHEFIIVNLSKGSMTLFESGAFINEYRKQHSLSQKTSIE